MLVGIIVESGFVAGVALSQAPIPPPPLKAVPFFVLNVTFASIFLLLLWWRHKAGYVGSIAVGIFSILIVIVIGAGALGSLAPDTNPIGPLVLVVLAVVLIVSTAAAWREKPKT